MSEDLPYYEKYDEWQRTRCGKPKVLRIKGRNMTFWCLREQGHEGECMEAIAAPRENHGHQVQD